MKKTYLILILFLFSYLLYSFRKKDLLHRPMPLLPAKTLDGKTIDEQYFKGHITVVSFMFIGCVPCMNEITALNRITDEYAAGGKVQVLCVARQMRSQMLEFNSSNKSIFYTIRKAMQADSIRYAIQPACNDEASKMVKSGADTVQEISLKSECSTIEDVYGVWSYPTIFYVDKKGMIKYMDSGGPPRKNDTAFYNKIKEEVETLLAE